MSLSNCIKCWDTPCTCGYTYKEYSRKRLKEVVLSIFNYREIKESKEILEEILEELKTKY